MILPIHIIGSKVLRRKATDFNLEDPKEYAELISLTANMYETMESADGLGLAAPQVGVSKRLFLVDATPLIDEDPSFADFKKEFINAKIIERGGKKETTNEGCLSIPDVHEDVSRESKIRIQYYDLDREFHDETYHGLPAIIIQHEYDHLDGILFTDYLSPIRRRLISKKLQKISRGKFERRYRFQLAK
jgi:peptide deformylase